MGLHQHVLLNVVMYDGILANQYDRDFDRLSTAGFGHESCAGSALLGAAGQNLTRLLHLTCSRCTRALPLANRPFRFGRLVHLLHIKLVVPTALHLSLWPNDLCDTHWSIDRHIFVPASTPPTAAVDAE